MDNTSPFRRIRSKLGASLRDTCGYRTRADSFLSPYASSTVEQELRGTNNGNGDEIADCGDDLESDRSSLVGTALFPTRHHHSMESFSSHSATSTTLEYSSDDTSSVAAFSASSQGSRRSRSSSSIRSTATPLIHYYNPQTIHTGSFVLSVLGSSSSSRTTSDIESSATVESDEMEDDLFASDHYFADPLDFLSSPKEQLRVASPFDSVGDSKCYIFTDDEDDYGLSITSKNVISDNNAVSHYRDRVNDSPQVSRHTWEQYNQNRGRIVAQQMLRPYRDRCSEGGDTDPLSDEDETGSNQFRPSLLWRVFGPYKRLSYPTKRFTQSTSALDQSKADENMTMKHRVSNLACQAIADAGMGFCGAKDRAAVEDHHTNVKSAVLTRNTLVDFSAWEAVLRANDKPSGVSSTLAADKHSEELALEDTSHSSDDEDDDWDDNASVLFIKSVSLLVQDFIFGHKPTMNRPSTTLLASSDRIKVDTSDRIHDDIDGLFSRRLSEDVAVALGIANEGQTLIRHIRGRAGIIDDLHDTETTNPTSQSSSIPWIHLYEDVWMSHYEEYVVRAVHSFSLLLFKPSTS